MRDEKQSDEPDEMVEDLDLPSNECEDIKGGKASPLLAAACAKGKHYSTVIINS